MVIKHKKYFQKLNLYSKLIMIYFLGYLIIMILNYANNRKRMIKSNKERNKLTDEILKQRKLEDIQNENKYSNNSQNVCSKAHKDLNEYYITGNYENSGELDHLITYDNNDKEKPYFKSHIINYLIYNKNETEEKKNLLKIESIKDDVKTYIKHMVLVLIFFGLGILNIILIPEE